MKNTGRIRSEIYFSLFVLFSIGTSVIWVRTSTVKNTYRYVQQEKFLRRIEQENQELRVQWLKLTSPKRLDLIASELKLSPPKIHQIFSYEPLKGILSSASR